MATSSTATRTETAALSAVVFDLDGTLVDSERHGHRVAFNRAFADCGIDEVWDDDVYTELLKVPGGKERLRHYLARRGWAQEDLDDVVPRLHRLKNAYFLDILAAGKLPPRPGSVRLIDDLVRRGVTLAIATTGSREWALPLVDRAFGLDRFAVVVAGDDVTSKKPDPEAFDLALQRLGLAPHDCLVVEDSLQGVRAAHRAGMVCVAVLNHYTRDDDVSTAALVVDGYGEPRRPARKLRGPDDAGFDGMLTPEVLVEIHRRAAT